MKSVSARMAITQEEKLKRKRKHNRKLAFTVKQEITKRQTLNSETRRVKLQMITKTEKDTDRNTTQHFDLVVLYFIRGCI